MFRDYSFVNVVFRVFLDLQIEQWINHPVEESSLDVYLIDVEVIIGFNGEQDSESHGLDHGCKHLIEVNAKLLQIASHHSSGREPMDGSIDVSFHLEGLFPWERFVTWFDVFF